MALTIKNLTFSFALIFAINLYLTESTVTLTSTNFDNYIGIANKLPLPAERLRVYEAIWGEIRATGSRNLTQIKVFYDALLNNINSTRPEEQEQTAELAAVVREQLIADNAHRFAETLNSKKAQDVLQVTQFRNQLYQDYDEALLTVIYEQAIDLAYAYQPADELYDMLDVIDSKLTNYKPQFNYRIRVNWTLYLYRKFLALGDINDQFVYKAAQTFHYLKRNQNYYKELTNITQRRIDMAFDSFTASLRHLFNTTNVCLENQNFQNYYIFYTPNIIANNVQAVLKNGYIEKTKWYNSYAHSNVVAQPNEFHFSYQPTFGYLYYRTTDWYVMVQRDSSRPTYMYWTPMLNKGFIMFGDLGRFMCATSEFNNDLKGFNIKVFTPTSMDDPMCQWRVTDCA